MSKTKLKTLDPLTFPLDENALIEASAGTGKTFTIAFLYVRLVLGIAPQQLSSNSDEQPLTIPNSRLAQGLLPSDILVVTFTEAATKELTDRIRANLVLAAEVFSDFAQIADDEDVSMIQTLKTFFDPSQYSACRSKLLNAVELMDEAAISTIHSWCNRMLSEHAFDSGSLFQIEVEGNQQAATKRAIQDYWRQNIYPLNGAILDTVTQSISSPNALHNRISSSIGKTHFFEKPQDWQAPFKEAAKLRQEIISQDWRLALDAADALVEKVGSTLKVNNRAVKATLTKALGSLREWCQNPAGLPQGFATLVGYSRLTTDGFAELNKASQQAHTLAITVLIDKLTELKHLESTQIIGLLRHASHCVAQQTQTEQLEKAEYGFEDLLVHLHNALCAKDAQGNIINTQLADTIAKQFPVAMIDEFQDTDPIQFGIFESIYLTRANADSIDTIATSLIMIGDPKQAIYSFRGGDIYTYLQASEAVGDNKYTLSTNYRSTDGMVTAVNGLFGQAEAQGLSAFDFSFKGDNPMPFNPVNANGLSSSLIIAEQEAKNLICWQALNKTSDDKVEPYAADIWRQDMANACAQQITDILQQSQQGSAYFLNHAKANENGTGEHIKETRTPILPGDIAIIVNKKDEADAVKSALLGKNLNSVYLSIRGSVLDTQQANDVLIWLKAVAEPMRASLLRNALGTASLDKSFTELHGLITDESKLDKMVQTFLTFKSVWQSQGVLPMLRRFMLAFNVQQTLLARVDGERAMTDLLHIGELLQQASLKIDGIVNLISYFEASLNAEDKGEVEFNKPRLESDSDLIQIVTVHKSKGLQYPLVFLPYATGGSTINNKQTFFSFHDDNGVSQVSFERKEAAKLLEKELKQEDIRKLYVGLTRSKYTTWVGIANSPNVHKSGIGHLLQIRSTKDDFSDRLNDLCKKLPANIEVTSLPVLSDTQYHAQTSKKQGKARQAHVKIKQTWNTFSYSGIQYEHKAATSHKSSADHAIGASDAELANLDEKVSARLLDNSDDQSTPADGSLNGLSNADELASLVTNIMDDEAGMQDDIEAKYVPQILNIHTFHKGAQPGTFLHNILEWAAHQGFSYLSLQPQVLNDYVATQAKNMGWEQYTQVLCDWMLTLIVSAIEIDAQKQKVSLAGMQTTVPELEFWFSTDNASLLEIDTLVTQHTFDGVGRPKANQQLMTGIFKGFIDLTFEHNGKYYVLDYKSNYLGENDESYTPENIEASILSHRYDLQFVIYIVALHRLLKQRLPDYDYDQHVGGCVYYFLRGVDANTKGVFHTKPPLALIEQIDAAFSVSAPLDKDDDAVLQDNQESAL